MKFHARLFSTLLLAGLLAGCSAHSSDLNGTWTGTDTRPNLAALSDTVTLTGEDSGISGTVVAMLSGAVVYTGSITGSFSTPTFQFTVAVPNGGVVGEPNCSLGILGSGTYVSGGGGTGPSKTLTGTFTVTPSGTCSIGTAALVDTFTWTQ